MDSKPLANRLRAAREALGISQLEAGTRIGRSDETISLWETGKQAVPIWMERFIEDWEQEAKKSVAAAK